MDKTHLDLSSIKPVQATAKPRAEAITAPLLVAAEGLEPLDGRARASDSGVELDTAVKKINDFIQIVQRDLEFSVDENTGRTVVTVLDSETGEVIRQIPPEEVLTIAANLEEAKGLLLKTLA